MLLQNSLGKNMKNQINLYLNGDLLYGDDFSETEIANWVNDEKEGYSTIVKGSDAAYEYPYRKLDELFFFNHLPRSSEIRALGIGSAYGEEFYPVLKYLKKIDIIEPSEMFFSNKINGVPVSYTKPEVSGHINFKDNTFDLVTCFSSLHHIPNVSFVLQEIKRVLKPGGYFFHRDPIVTMRDPIKVEKDFFRPMPGLSKRERGIPLKYFRAKFRELDFEHISEKLIGMPTTRKAANIIIKGKSPYNSKYLLALDRFSSFLFQWNTRYSRGTLPKIIAICPQIVCNVLKKKS